MDAVTLVQRTLDGALDGAAYALVGLGLTLTFGVLGRVNLAYGAGAMLATYVGAWLHARHGAPVWMIAFAVAAAAGLIGLYVEWLCFAPTRDDATRSGASLDGSGALPAAVGGREVAALAASFAVWMQLEQLAVHLLPRHLNPFPSLAAQGEWALGALHVRPDRLVLAALAVVLTLALHRWLLGSATGLAWRAASSQRTAASLCGVSVARVQRSAFVLACALAGLAAFALAALDGQLTPMLGMSMLVKGLIAAMLGGLGSIPGVLGGGVVLGIVEAHAQGWAGAAAREFAGFALLFAALVLPWQRLGLGASGAFAHGR